MEYRIGHSHDIHRLSDGRKLILGGVEIDYPLGLVGHSDADCVLHVVSEAIIGALGLGDLGTHFPDTDNKYKNIDSSYFVIQANNLLKKHKYEIGNLDITIFIEKPILKPYTPLMKTKIANLLDIKENQVNIKATRGEKLGYIGRGEGVGAECVVLIKSTQIIKKLNL